MYLRAQARLRHVILKSWTHVVQIYRKRSVLQYDIWNTNCALTFPASYSYQRSKPPKNTFSWEVYHRSGLSSNCYKTPHWVFYCQVSLSHIHFPLLPLSNTLFLVKEWVLMMIWVTQYIRYQNREPILLGNPASLLQRSSGKGNRVVKAMQSCPKPVMCSTCRYVVKKKKKSCALRNYGGDGPIV